MKKAFLTLLAFALLFGAKAFAQEWEWDYCLTDNDAGFFLTSSMRHPN